MLSATQRYWLVVAVAVLAAVALMAWPPIHEAEAQTVNTPVQQEWLVATTSACVTRLTGSKTIELYNHGPGNIYCSLTTAAVVNKARAIPPETAWALDIPATVPVCCISGTLQATTAATTVTQVR